MQNVEFEFTNEWGAGVNAQRLCSIMSVMGHEIEHEDTQSDYIIFYVDGVRFENDWKHNNFESWAGSIESLGYEVKEVSNSKLVFSVKSDEHILNVMTTQESYRRAVAMFS